LSMEMELMEHVRYLCEKTGSRPIGSTENHAAAKYIENIFRNVGLEVEHQNFACPVWEHHGTMLLLDGKPLEATLNTFSLPCDIVASMVAFGTLEELEALELGGRIGVMYGDLTKETLVSKANKIYNPERHQNIIRLLEAKNPSALIMVAHSSEYLPLIEDWDFAIPSVTVSPEVGLELLRNESCSLQLTINSEMTPSDSSNVIARKLGSQEERIVPCAHYDTKYGTPGAVDNAGGVSVLLALADELAKREVPVGLEFIAFNGEEYLGLAERSQNRITARIVRWFCRIHTQGYRRFSVKFLAHGVSRNV
jgi:aminopeptidase YwaD